MAKQFKLTVKGQVTIPKDVRDALGLKPGDRVAFATDGDRYIVRKGEPAPDEEKSAAAYREKVRLALERFPARDLGMATDDYMAMIREPVPVPDKK